jgi:hypothetical protein
LTIHAESFLEVSSPEHFLWLQGLDAHSSTPFLCQPMGNYEPQMKNSFLKYVLFRSQWLMLVKIVT